MRKFLNMLLVIIACFVISSCKTNEESEEFPSEYLVYPESSNLEYIDYGTENGSSKYIKDYNKDMWFYNELKDVPLPDPFVYSEDGKYYVTGTNDIKGGDTIDIYVTEDFSNYEVFEAYRPKADWEKQGEDALIFAPEIHKYDGYYYLTYSNVATNGRRYISFLKSESIMGPFEIIQEYNSLGGALVRCT